MDQATRRTYLRTEAHLQASASLSRQKIIKKGKGEGEGSGGGMSLHERNCMPQKMGNPINTKIATQKIN